MLDPYAAAISAPVPTSSYLHTPNRYRISERKVHRKAETSSRTREGSTPLKKDAGTHRGNSIRCLRRPAPGHHGAEDHGSLHPFHLDDEIDTMVNGGTKRSPKHQPPPRRVTTRFGVSHPCTEPVASCAAPEHDRSWDPVWWRRDTHSDKGSRGSRLRLLDLLAPPKVPLHRDPLLARRSSEGETEAAPFTEHFQRFSKRPVPVPAVATSFWHRLPKGRASPDYI